MYRIPRFASALIVAALLCACAEDPVELEPIITGVISQVRTQPLGISVRDPAGDPLCNQAFAITSSTVIRIRNSGENDSHTTAADLAVGQTATVWTSQPFSLNCGGSDAVAERILITK